MYIDNTPGKKEAISSVHLRSHIVRLLAVPFWIVERACEIAESASYQQRGQIGARRKKNEKRLGTPTRSLQVSAFSLSYFARSLDYQKGTASSLPYSSVNKVK